ncbi:MAG: flagellar basal body rod protein FlgB [Halioglobus sp.]|nr:flagellar basal body rod protein FlgB [Halioglobus sp.]
MNMIDKAFGVAPQALVLRAQRFELISANIANADTPGYKARDIDFADALSRAREGAAPARVTHPAHIATSDLRQAVLYRTPAQATLDGNTVETEQEHAAFMDNAIRYQASLNFLNGRIKSILGALRGE